MPRRPGIPEMTPKKRAAKRTPATPKRPRATAKKTTPQPRPPRTPAAPSAKAPRGRGFPIVAIGASAGGLQAFQALLQNLPNDAGMAYVLIQHLEPGHTSHLPELLSRATDMPVTTLVDGQRLAPDTVHVMPPSVEVRLRNGTVWLS